MYFVTEREVYENFDMPLAINAMKEAFEEYYKGNAGSNSRARTFAGESVLSTMPAFMDKYHVAGFKSYIASRSGAKFVVLLFDTSASELLAIVEANRLGQMRTGAVPAVATSILHGKCSVFALIGSGFQAETQLEGILKVSDPEEIRVYSRTFSHRKAFAERMSKMFEREIKYYDNLKTTLDGADVISCITSSGEPIITDLSFNEAYHLNLAGSNMPSRREASGNVIAASDLVVVEHLEQALIESSEISEFVKGGGKAVELKEVVGSGASFNGHKRTLFKSMGIGLEDISSAYHVLKRMKLI